mmetsp:Transcript_121268/g.258835  ORF Transcript_121268/g.258835 Transcript_121268/m.258835 type:complete len:629 (-) Transcript_121268:75-1961(-)
MAAVGTGLDNVAFTLWSSSCDLGAVPLSVLLSSMPMWTVLSLAFSIFTTAFAVIASTRALLTWDTIHWPWSPMRCCGTRFPGILEPQSRAAQELRCEEVHAKERALRKRFQSIIGSETADERMSWPDHAGMLRTLLMDGYLDSASIIDGEGMLDFFAAHRVLARQSCLHCSLGIRLTVHYNLFCGTILALGSEAQQVWLQSAQQRGILGCFMLTEMGAGVLSGLIVETVAEWVWTDDGQGAFDLHTPSPSATKTWISQGLAADWGVVIAQLLVEGQLLGPHVFLVNMNAEGVSRECMGSKSVFTALDNARVSFNHVRLPQTALLSKFCSVEASRRESGRHPEYKFVGDRPPSFAVIAQRLLSGRLCISDSAVAYFEGVLDATEKYTEQRLVWIDRERRLPLAELPYMANVLRRIRGCANVYKTFLLLLQKRFASAMRDSGEPSRELVTLVAAAKVEAVEFAINSLALLRRNVGAFGLMADSPFGCNNDILLCCRFAEGDSRILQQMITRDLLRAYSQPSALARLVCQVLKAWISGAWRTQTRLRYSRDLQLLTLLWLLKKHVRTNQGSNKVQAQTDAWLAAGDLVYNVAKAHAQLLIHGTIVEHFGRSRDTDHFLAMSTTDCEVCRAY